MTALFNRASLTVLAIAALGMAAGGCTEARSQYAPYEGYQAPAAAPAPVKPAETAPADSDDGPPPAAMPVEAVPSQALPPVNRRPDARPSPVQTNPDVTPSYSPPAPAPLLSQAPAAKPPKAAPKPKPPEPVYILSVKGKVVASKDKTKTIIVDNGDTLNMLADRFLVAKAEVIKVNRLKKPFEVDTGKPLKIPTPKAYVVESGDTLYSIAKRFNVSVDVLAELNQLDPKGRLRSGEQVALPVGVEDSGPIKRLAPAGSPPRGTGEAPPERPRTTYTPQTQGPQPYAPDQGERSLPPVRGMTSPTVVAPLVDQSPAPTDADVAAAGRGRFIWPVRGNILSGFGLKPGGQRNDGMDIGGTTGEPVTAAAAGEVVYAGNQVPGFGNLVLIKHEGGWVTAYAHLSRTEVKIKDHVSQGDEIGQVGTSGGVTQPQLHFEIRYAPSQRDKARPIDPTLVLVPR